MQRFKIPGAVAVFLLANAAWATDFVDTRLSFVFADENLLAKAGESSPPSTLPGFGADRANNQFYDNFDTRFSGFETMSNIVLYKRSPSFFEGLTTEAALVINVLEENGLRVGGVTAGAVTLRDNSSYIRLNYTPGSWSPKENISLTAFPVSADRFRLGYAYRITWGGSDVFTKESVRRGVPGVKLQVTRDNWYAFAGAKTAILLNQLINEPERAYGLLGGAGFDPTSYLRFEASGGYFQKGLVPGLASQGIEAPVNSAGASARAVLHVGAPVGTSVDLRLYRNDPEVYEKLFNPEKYEGGLSYVVSLEGSVLYQTLEDPDVFARTRPQRADAIAFQTRAKFNYLRAHVLALYRSLSFIQFNVPGLPPYRDFPAIVRDTPGALNPEMFVAVGADYHFPDWHFTPGFIIGLQQPASFTTPQTELGGQNPSDAFAGARTLVIRDENLFNILPRGFRARPIFSAKTTFRWDLSETVAAIGEVYYTRDPNRTTFRDDVTGVALLVNAVETLEDPHSIGFNAVVQARF